MICRGRSLYKSERDMITLWNVNSSSITGPLSWLLLKKCELCAAMLIHLFVIEGKSCLINWYVSDQIRLERFHYTWWRMVASLWWTSHKKINDVSGSSASLGQKHRMTSNRKYAWGWGISFYMPKYIMKTHLGTSLSVTYPRAAFHLTNNKSTII